MPGTVRPSRDAADGWGLVVLGGFSAISPLCTDIYTPSLPDVVAEFSTTPSAVQLTLTGFMLGMALGQLCIGSLSDAVGRRRLLLGGGAVCVLATIACALAPTIGVFIAARVLQGFAGAAGVVLARAIIADSTQGARTAQLLGILMVVVGIAPIVAPLIGSLLAEVFGWRGVFWAIALVMTAVTLLAVRRIPETLPPGRRRSVGVLGVARNIGTVLRRRGYLGYLLTFVLAFGAFFAYISASAFVFRTQLGFSAVGYGAIFALGALCMTGSTVVAARLAGRVRYESMITVGTAGVVLGALLILAATLTGTPLWLLLTGCLVLTGSMGQVMSNCTAQALSHTRDLSGAGSAVLGTCQFLMAGLVAPLVGLAGENDPRPFGIVVVVGAVAALAAFWLVARGAPAATTEPNP